MSAKRPTQNAIDIYNFVVDTVRMTGVPVTIKEIVEGLGLSTTSLARHHVMRLEEAGILERNGSEVRTIMPAGTKLIVPRMTEDEILAKWRSTHG